MSNFLFASTSRTRLPRHARPSLGSRGQPGALGTTPGRLPPLPPAGSAGTAAHGSLGSSRLDAPSCSHPAGKTPSAGGEGLEFSTRTFGGNSRRSGRGGAQPGFEAAAPPGLPASGESAQPFLSPVRGSRSPRRAQPCSGGVRVGRRCRGA